MADEEKKYGVKEPNEGTDGMVASNMTGEAIKPTFDYGDITERDKDVVMEIIRLLRERENIPYDMIIEEMKIKFQLEEIPMQDISHSVWGQMTKDERIGQSIQGFRMATDENGKKIKIPHVGFSADLDYLNEFIQRLVKKIGQIKEQK